MEQQHQGCNGWRNYATWIAYTKLSDEEDEGWGLLAEWLDSEECEAADVGTREDVCRFAEWLKARAQDDAEKIQVDTVLPLWEWVRSAIEETDWFGIAERLIQDKQED